MSLYTDQCISLVCLKTVCTLKFFTDEFVDHSCGVPAEKNPSPRYSRNIQTHTRGKPAYSARFPPSPFPCTPLLGSDSSVLTVQQYRLCTITLASALKIDHTECWVFNPCFQYLDCRHTVQLWHSWYRCCSYGYCAVCIMQEIYPPRLTDFSYVTDGACTDEQILQQEVILLKVHILIGVFLGSLLRRHRLS